MNCAGPRPATYEIAIVGSGPAALACAWQLISRGHVPVIVDAGETLPEPAAARVEELRATHGNWRRELVDQVTHNPTLRPGQPLPKKLVFGSDYFHGRGRKHSPLANDSFVDPTFALGGYTVAWGGAMLPMRPVDMAAWPEAARGLDEGFTEVMRRLPVSGREDGLAEPFPLFGASLQSLQLTGQAEAVLRRLERLQDVRRFASGQARLAVHANECRYCGMCLSGCPFGVIQGFDAEMGRLAQQGAVDYRSGIVVTRLLDDGDGVALHAVDPQGQTLPTMRFARVFLAAGAINSARIALESADLHERPVQLLDSQKFAVPMLVPHAQSETDDAVNTLPALFVDMLQGNPGHWVHLQMSPFSHYARVAMAQKLRIGPLRLDRLAEPLTRRLMVGWGGLHSDLSDTFSLRLLRAHRWGRPVLRMQAHPTAVTRQHARDAMRELVRVLHKAGVHMLSPSAVIGPPGAGFHFGGSLPMRERPEGPLQADASGQLGLWRNVRVIDSAVMPSIPATTMVLTIMANAWRITRAAKL